MKNAQTVAAAVKDETKLLDNYLDIIEPSLFYGILNKDSQANKELVIFRHYNFHSSLIDYCKAYDYNNFAFFTNKAEIKA